jgi:hypothetical protein
MKNSKFLKLNAFDLVKGLVVAVITAVLTADIGYMLKNLSTNSGGGLFMSENKNEQNI